MKLKNHGTKKKLNIFKKMFSTFKSWWGARFVCEHRNYKISEMSLSFRVRRCAAYGGIRNKRLTAIIDPQGRQEAPAGDFLKTRVDP